MNAHKVLSLLAGLLAVGVVSSLADIAPTPSSNSSKPVIFLKTPVVTSSPNSSSDSGNSESRVNQKIITELPLPRNAEKKQAVSSRGYQLEVLNDDTSEEGQETSGQAQKRSEQQLNTSPTTHALGYSSGLVDQYLHTDYDDNSAKEDLSDDYALKGKHSYGDTKPTSDLSHVRDLFISQGVGEKHSPHLPLAHTTDYSPVATPYGPKHKSEFDDSHSPKYGSAPLVLKHSGISLGDASPVPLPIPLGHHPHHHHDEVHGHAAGYGHGFHHHQQKLKAKPLKPSVVYRDPHDRFDHHDKIRTLDKDHLGIDKGSNHHDDHFDPHHHKGHGFNNGYRHHGKKVFHHEYIYDQSKIPECAHKNKYIYNLTFCLDDPHYPTDTIMYALKDAGHIAKKLLSDVTYQSADNLVTGLTRAEEEGYTYKHYFGASHAQNVHLDKYKPPYHGYTYSTDYFKKGGYICPSDIYYARPKRAMNTFGKWKVIVNVDFDHDHHGNHGHSYGHDHHSDHGHAYGHQHNHHDSYGKDHEDHHHHLGHSYDSGNHGHSIKKREYKEHKKAYTQTLRLEQCIYPNAPCSYVDSHYHSHCIQKHNFVRLVAWTHEDGIHVDTFKMPIACSCHVRQPIHFYHESGHHGHEHGHVVPSVKTYHGHPHSHSEPVGVIKKIY